MMARHKIWNLLKRLLLAALLTVPLAGCLELDEEISTVPVVSAVPDVVISGSVGDGPVIGATITVYSNSGEVLGSIVSDSAATFRSTLKVRGSQYPLRLVVSGGTDLVTGTTPDFEMISVMLRPSDKQVNINPFTTLIVLMAEQLSGGLNSVNVDAARAIVLQELGFGLDATVIADPVTTEITVENVANLVKASEALGEMVRRTRDLIAATGKSTSGNRVLAVLAADLTDGVVDGLGGVGSNPIVASVANVVSSQVLVETICNRLRVWGVVATQVMDQSIAATRSGVSNSQLTGNVAVSAQLLEQARIAVAAAQVLDSGSDLMGLAAGIASLSPGSLPDEAIAVLSADSSLVLVNAVNQVATASAGDVDAINQAVAADGNTTPPPLVNTAPLISGTPAGSVTVDNSYVFQPSASDIDGDSLSFRILNKPMWASFNVNTGRLSGTPADTQTGNFGDIVISVTDGTDTASLPAFAIQVTPTPVVNTPPVISGSPASSVMATSRYQFQPVASDADGDSLSFTIANKPSWTSFSTSTGRLSGTPNETQARTYNGIVISVTDGADTVSLPAFTIQVTPTPVVNTPPVISGSPASSVMATSRYQFQPVASDADGDSLSFTIANKPSWASFSTGTGRLSGTPNETQARTYNGIVISVTDGTDTTSLAAFSIVVNAAPVQTGSMSLTWVPPVERADGTPLSLSEIDGYRLYYGTTSGDYPNSVDIADGTALSATITDLPVGSYYVVMSTYDRGGLEGEKSSPVVKTVQ